MTDLVDDFAQRLQAFERDGDAGPLVELFADDAELSKLDHVDVERGADGARRFWEQYRGVFEQVESTFGAVTSTDDRDVLEWTAEGKLRDGRPIRYPGVSVLEVADGKVRRFRTYYDSAPFVLDPRGA